LLDGRDRGEVRGAAADVDDEDHVAHLHVLAPAIAARCDPGVERRLRLFEQGEVLEARGARGLDGEIARGGVERGGDGEDDLLLGERDLRIVLGVRVIPGLGEVLEVAPRGLDGRDLLDVLGAPTGRIVPRRSTPGWQSQLLALETTRAGASTPRERACSPTTKPRSASQGRACGPSLACAR
jgi:hypothetical protein